MISIHCLVHNVSKALELPFGRNLLVGRNRGLGKRMTITWFMSSRRIVSGESKCTLKATLEFAIGKFQGWKHKFLKLLDPCIHLFIYDACFGHRVYMYLCVYMSMCLNTYVCVHSESEKL